MSFSKLRTTMRPMKTFWFEDEFMTMDYDEDHASDTANDTDNDTDADADNETPAQR